MNTPREELEKINRQRLADEARAARLAKTAAGARPGLAQWAMHSAGESLVSLGSWMKQVSQGEPAKEQLKIRFNH